MTEIKAPYNFVPLNEKVFFPPWGPSISHDVPFKGGLSGHLKLKITAETPIFIRGGGQEGGTSLKFSNVKGKYFIPGSSLKGMLRAVLEIMSFGKLTQFNKPRYGVRDFGNKSLYTLVGKSKNIRCGWLVQNVNGSGHPYIIYDCGLASNEGYRQGQNRHTPDNIVTDNRVHQREIRKNGAHESFYDIFAGNHRNFKNNNPDHKKAKHKYALYHGNNIEVRQLFSIPDTSDGCCYVFTGQPNNNRGRGKYHEFKFKHLNYLKDKSYTISESLFNDFKFIYNDHDKSNISADWDFFKPRLEAGKEIPVFFLMDEDEKEVLHFGLSMLYKIPYTYSIENLVNKTQKLDKRKKDQPDLADCIFGYTQEDSQAALKSRVYIGHAFASSTDLQPEYHKRVLMGPKASYYPTYIKQKVNKNGYIIGNENYKTMMDKDAEINGYKRYPVHTNFRPYEEQENVAESSEGENEDNSALATSFYALPAGTSFETTIYYHNLLPAEMGAFLSAITFHDTAECRHSLGMGKPFGYGRVHVEIVSGMTNEEKKKYLFFFETIMNAQLPVPWRTTEQMTELLSMAWPAPNQDVGSNAGKLDYLMLKKEVNGREINEFVEIKNHNRKQALPRYSLFMTDCKKECKSVLDEEIEKLNMEIAYLQDNKIEILDQIIQAEKEKNVKRALEEGITSLLQTNSFDKLNTLITTSWAKHFHDKESYGQVVKALYGKIIPAGELKQFLKHLEHLYNDASGKERKDWDKRPLENNNRFKKLCEWIGEDKARGFFDGLPDQ